MTTQDPQATYDEIQATRDAAHAKHGENSIEGIDARDPRWLSILVEEVGEVAHELTYDATGDLRAELLQVAAVAAAWVDAIDLAAAAAEAWTPGDCEGHDACSSNLHVHGCFADLDGSACDDPKEHA